MKPPSYERFFDVEELTMSDREVTAYKDSINRLRTMLKGWQDPVLFILVTCIVMYTPDFLELDDAKGVEKMQTTFACLLHR